MPISITRIFLQLKQYFGHFTKDWGDRRIQLETLSLYGVSLRATSTPLLQEMLLPFSGCSFCCFFRLLLQMSPCSGADRSDIYATVLAEQFDYLLSLHVKGAK